MTVDDQGFTFGDAIYFLEHAAKDALRRAGDLGALSRGGQEELKRASSLSYAAERLQQMLVDSAKQKAEYIAAAEADERWDETSDARR